MSATRWRSSVHLMNATVTIGIIIVLVLIGLGAWLWWAGETPRSQEEQTPSWQDFHSQMLAGGWRFAVSYPPDVEVANPAPGTYSFKYIGPQSEPNTEITDGYFVTISTLGDVELSAYLAQTHNIIGEVTPVQFNGHTARRYQVQTELGTVAEHTIFTLNGAPERHALVDISASIMGDTDGSYQREVGEMLASLEFMPTR